MSLVQRDDGDDQLRGISEGRVEESSPRWSGAMGEFLVRSARQEIEKGIETPVERSAKLRNRPVKRVQRQSCRRSVCELQRRFFNAFERAFGNEPHAVNEGVSRHSVIVQAGRSGGSGRSRFDDLLRGGHCFGQRGNRAIHLLFVNGFQDFTDAWTWLQAEREQMPAEQNRRRGTMLDAERTRALE